MAFPFLFLEHRFSIFQPWAEPGPEPHFWIFQPREIAPPTRRWLQSATGVPFRESFALNTTFGKWAFGLIYLAFNIYVVFVPLKKPYEDGSGKPLEIQGWYYIAISAGVVVFGISYYYLTIGSVDATHPNRSILRAAGIRPWIDPTQPANGRAVEVTVVSQASLPSIHASKCH